MTAIRDKQLIGAAGEHLVLSRLLSRGLLASQAPRGARKADILVNPLDGGRPLLIQVKTRLAKREGEWIFSKKVETMREDDLFFCLVDMRETHSNVYVMPSEVLAEVTKVQHATWLSLPGKQGQRHIDTDMRTVSYKFPFRVPNAPDGWMDKYLEAWEVLG
jgi:hypothetical protein